MPTDQDGLAAALDAAADTAEQTAADQRRAARSARQAAAARRERPAGDPLRVPEAVRHVVELVGASAARLTSAVAVLRRAWAQALADQRLSTREIGQQLGISHQRVSALLARRPRRNGARQR